MVVVGRGHQPMAHFPALCNRTFSLSQIYGRRGGEYRIVVGWNEKNKELRAGVFSPVRMKRVFKMKRMFSLFVFYATAALSIITL